MTPGAMTLSVVNSFNHAVKFITADADDNLHTSLNLVYDSKGSMSFLSVDGYAKGNRTEFNCTHW